MTVVYFLFKTGDIAVYVLKVGVVLNTTIWGHVDISLSLGLVECEGVFRIGSTDELPLNKRWNQGLQTDRQFRGK
jgi:hypothetical protein